MKKAILSVLALFAFLAGTHVQAFSGFGYGYYPRWAADEYIINRPVNIQGLTGLLFTNSAYTQPAGSVTIGFGGIGEKRSDPDYSVGQGTASITVGLTDSVEAGVRGKIYATKLESTTSNETSREKGVGDTDLLLKWKVSSQGEVMPAIALGAGWTFPTGHLEKGFGEVKRESIKLMVMLTGENRILDEGFLGIYAEGQAVFNEELHKDYESPYKERYGVVNAGLLFPLSTENNLQFLLEYTRVSSREHAILYDRNYTGVTPGLRFVTENFNLTLGLQRVKRETEPGSEPQRKRNRLAGTINYRF